MYKVIKYFVDLKDGNHAYNVGDAYPREGVTVTDERIAELSGSENRQKTPLIQFVEDTPAADDTPAVEDIAKMTVSQLKDYAAAKGIDLAGAVKKDEILAKIKEAETTD